MTDLFTFGEVMALFLTEEPLLTAHTFNRQSAGAEANVAVTVSRLGLQSRFFTRLSSDALGQVVLNDLVQEEVDVSGVKRTSGFTGVLVRDTGRGQPIEAAYARNGSAASTMEPSDIADEWIAQSKWVHGTGITAALSNSCRQTLDYVFAQSRQAEKRISFDLNIRRKLWSEQEAASTLNPIAHDLELLVGGLDEFEIVFGTRDPKKLGTIASDRNITYLVMTSGAGALRVITHTEQLSYSPPQVITQDPVGSGDAFTGGVIAGLLAGTDLHGAIEQGMKCGSSVAADVGDWRGLPYGSAGRIGQGVTA